MTTTEPDIHADIHTTAGKLADLRKAGVDLRILFVPGTCTNAMVGLALETMTNPSK